MESTENCQEQCELMYQQPLVLNTHSSRHYFEQQQVARGGKTSHKKRRRKQKADNGSSNNNNNRSFPVLSGHTTLFLVSGNF